MRLALFALVLGSIFAPAADTWAQARPPAPTLELPRSLRVDPVGYEIAWNRNRQPSLFWPAVVSTGGVLVFGGAAGLAAVLLVANAIWGSMPAREFAGELGGIYVTAGIGAGLAGIGIPWLVRTIARRAPYARRIRELEQYGRALRAGHARAPAWSLVTF